MEAAGDRHKGRSYKAENAHWRSGVEQTGDEYRLSVARTHLQHVMKLFDLAGFLFCQEECKTMGGPHTGHTFTYRCYSWAFYQSVIFIRM